MVWYLNRKAYRLSPVTKKSEKLKKCVIRQDGNILLYFKVGEWKMLKNMQEVLENIFDILNDEYFEGALPKVVVTIMSSPRTNGHFTVGKVWSAEQENLNEINISAEHLNRPIENIAATMCHEMVHFYCQINNIAETSQYGRYHNKLFKDEAEKRGLKISYAKSIGWSVTEPTESFIEVLTKYHIKKPLDINRDGVRVTITGGQGDNSGGGGTSGIGITGKKKPRCSTRKYVCSGGCGCSFRATKEINVLCMDCNAKYVPVD